MGSRQGLPSLRRGQSASGLPPWAMLTGVRRHLRAGAKRVGAAAAGEALKLQEREKTEGNTG